MISAPAFVRNCNRELDTLNGTQLSGKSIASMRCHLTQSENPLEDSMPRRFRITDKHGLSRYAYNLQVDIDLEGEKLSLGLDSARLPGRTGALAAAQLTKRNSTGAASAEEMYDDLAIMLRKRAQKAITED